MFSNFGIFLFEWGIVFLDIEKSKKKIVNYIILYLIGDNKYIMSFGKSSFYKGFLC